MDSVSGEIGVLYRAMVRNNSSGNVDCGCMFVSKSQIPMMVKYGNQHLAVSFGGIRKMGEASRMVESYESI